MQIHTGSCTSWITFMRASIQPRRGRCGPLSLHAWCARRPDNAILNLGRRHRCGKRWSASMATMHRTSSTRYSGGACSCFSLVLGQAQTAVSHNFCVPAPRMPVRESRCPPSRMRREKYGRDLASGQVHGWVRVSCDPHCSRATF